MSIITPELTPPSQEFRTELLRTPECLRIGPELTARENEYFGSDFEWSTESTERWLHSGGMFYAAVSRTRPDANRRIVALASVLVTGTESCERLISGAIREQELSPWFLESADSAPVLYFSSVLSEKQEYLPLLYANLLLEVGAYVHAHQLNVRSGFSIAAGPAGFQHLSKNGFVPTPGAYYMHKYRFMRIDASSAKTEFWCRLLGAPPSEASTRQMETGPRLSELLGLHVLGAVKSAAA